MKLKQFFYGWVVAAALAGCVPGITLTATNVPTVQTPTAQTLTFSSLAQGETTTADITGPRLFIARQAAETQAFAPWLTDANVMAALAQVDYTQMWVVAVFLGKVSSPGYSITVQEVQWVAPDVYVFVQITQPPTGQPKSDIITYPYHLITVPAAKLTATGPLQWWVVSTEGGLLTQTQFP